MKKFRVITIVIIVIIGFPLVVLAINKIYSSRYDKQYSDANTGGSPQHYTLTRLNIPGKAVFHSSNEAAAAVTDTDIEEEKTEDVSGHLYYDATLKKVFVETEQDSSEPNTDGYTKIEYLVIDGSGTITKVDSIPLNAKLLNNQIEPFHNYSDASQVIHMEHFAKQEFNADALNPFSTFNPTGGGEKYYWLGKGYYTIKFKDDTFKVKIRCERSALFFASNNDYYNGLYYYPLPDQDIGFVVYSGRFSFGDIYMIKRK